MSKYLVIFSLLLILFPTQVFAEQEQNESTETASVESNEVKTQSEPEMSEAPEKEKHKGVQKFILKTPSDLSNLKEKRNQFMQELQQKKSAFKEKIGTMKDEAKKTLAEKVDTNLSVINKRRTDQMSQTITKLETLLSKMRTKSNELGTAGKDITSIISALTAADTAIAAAKTAIAAQSAKIYTPTVTDTTTLKSVMGVAMKQLQADLLTTRKTVISAKEAVVKAAIALRTVQGTSVSPKPTDASMTPTVEPTQ